ncbi:hypothetical protein VKS41_003539 [Umbelopsis sp. WA50703]
MNINTDGTAATILKDEIIHKRYITVWNRITRFDDGREISWDVVGHSTPLPTFVTVFTFDTNTKTTCILKEFAQGTNEIKYCCTAGSFDRRKHADTLEAAQHELSEEAQLKGGHWISLLPSAQPNGISELKWGTNRFVPYICINPVLDENPKDRDAEEYMEIVRDVTIDEFTQFVMRGEVMLPSVQTGWMAIEWLKENKYI